MKFAIGLSIFAFAAIVNAQATDAPAPQIVEDAPVVTQPEQPNPHKHRHLTDRLCACPALCEDTCDDNCQCPPGTPPLPSPQSNTPQPAQE